MNFICTHKDFKCPKEGLFTIISNKPLEGKYSIPVIVADNELSLFKNSLCEGYMIYDIWKKQKCDFVGINHYRRFLVGEYPLLPTPIRVDIYTQYGIHHNILDLLLCKEIIEENYDYDTSSTVLYPCNMFVLSWEDFDRYCSFVFDVLKRFCDKKNFKNDEDIKAYTKDAYLSRLLGFLMERIGTIFFINYFKDKPFKTNDIENI